MNASRILITTSALFFLACSGAQVDANNTKNNASNNDNNPPKTNNAPGAVAYDGLVINEIVAAGDPHDWVELYNGSDSTINLDGLVLSDSISMPDKTSVIPEGMTLDSKSFLTLDVGTTELPFKLGKDEELGLFAPNGEIIDSVDWDVDASPADASYGRLPDGTGDFRTLWTQTRDGANAAGDAPECGNGTIDHGEVCDGDVFGMDTCVTQGFASGDLACAQDCATLDTSGCVMDMSGTWDGLVVNEIAAKGDPNDWIELYNGGSSALDVGELLLRDDGGEYAIPAGTMIEQGGFLTFDADDQTLPFKLGADEFVGIYTSEGMLIDKLDWADGESPAGGSYGRVTDGADTFKTFEMPTRGASNGG